MQTASLFKPEHRMVRRTTNEKPPSSPPDLPSLFLDPMKV
jgi:hypothetical protein